MFRPRGERGIAHRPMPVGGRCVFIGTSTAVQVVGNHVDAQPPCDTLMSPRDDLVATIGEERYAVSDAACATIKSTMGLSFPLTSERSLRGCSKCVPLRRFRATMCTSPDHQTRGRNRSRPAEWHTCRLPSHVRLSGVRNLVSCS